MAAACVGTTEDVVTIARPAHMGGDILHTARFDLKAASRFSPGASSVSIYIEGDGFAWVTATQPSQDPTPKNPLALHLAVADSADSVVWLARPCQYVGGQSGRNCNQSYWTDARYAAEVISAYGEALDQIKAKSGASRIKLYGYSGGGTIVALLAASRSDVEVMVTIAGLLDVGAWTAQGGMSPLRRSLDPAQQLGPLSRQRQIHFAGAADQAVPASVTRGSAAKMGHEDNFPLVVLPGYDHHCCWEEAWPGLLRRVEKEARVPG